MVFQNNCWLHIACEAAIWCYYKRPEKEASTVLDHIKRHTFSKAIRIRNSYILFAFGQIFLSSSYHYTKDSLKLFSYYVWVICLLLSLPILYDPIELACPGTHQIMPTYRNHKVYHLPYGTISPTAPFNNPKCDWPHPCQPWWRTWRLGLFCRYCPRKAVESDMCCASDPLHNIFYLIVYFFTTFY